MGLDDRTWTNWGYKFVGVAADGRPELSFIGVPIPDGVTTGEERTALTRAIVDTLNAVGEPVLTSTQRAVLDFVRAHHEKYQRMPSLREIGDAIGRTHSTADAALTRLSVLGLVSRPPKGTRRPGAAISFPTQLTPGETR